MKVACIASYMIISTQPYQKNNKVLEKDLVQ